MHEVKWKVVGPGLRSILSTHQCHRIENPRYSKFSAAVTTPSAQCYYRCVCCTSQLTSSKPAGIALPLGRGSESQ